MNSKKLRHLLFALHRYLGLAVGLVLIIVGLTGSLLVFHSEINSYLLHRQIGTITLQGERLSVEVVLNTARAKYANLPDFSIQRLYLPEKPDDPFNVVLKTKDSDWTEVYVNPYTGIILGSTLEKSLAKSFLSAIYEIHYALMAGEAGTIIVGIAALFMFILSVTGIILWSGWRKLIAGFKIKWNAHPKRVNFDIHE